MMLVGEIFLYSTVLFPARVVHTTAMGACDPHTAIIKTVTWPCDHSVASEQQLTAHLSLLCTSEQSRSV